MSSMFESTEKLDKLDICLFDVSNSKNFTNMFKNSNPGIKLRAKNNKSFRPSKATISELEYMNNNKFI